MIRWQNLAEAEAKVQNITEIALLLNASSKPTYSFLANAVTPE